MTVLDNSADQELLRLWSLIGDLSEELSRNRALSVTLYGQVGSAKVSIYIAHFLKLHLNIRRIKLPIPKRASYCDDLTPTNLKVCCATSVL